MQPKTSAFALLCLALAGAAHAGPDTTGALPVPANRVLGLWEASGTVTPCNGGPGPVVQVANTTVFQSGGTLVENPRTPTIARVRLRDAQRDERSRDGVGGFHVREATAAPSPRGGSRTYRASPPAG